MDFPIIKEKYRGYLESNSRIRLEEPANINQYLFRTALGYRIRPNIEFFQGYGWIQNWIPRYVQEQRIYQQLGIGHKLFKDYAILHRFRTEQRIIESRSGVSNRGRYFLRIVRPIAETKFYLVGYDELFVNFNSLKGGPDAGFDQNRLFAGIGRQVNRHIRAEVGYQWQYVNLPGPVDNVSAQILMTQFFVHF